MEKRIIILVEDDLITSKLEKMILQKKFPSHTILTCFSGEAAVKEYKFLLKTGSEHLVDLILSDFEMPLKNGIETILEIQSIHQLSGSRNPFPKTAFVSSATHLVIELINAKRLSVVKETQVFDKPFTSNLLERILLQPGSGFISATQG